MHHGVAHFDTGWEAVGQDAANLMLEYRQQKLGLSHIRFFQMQGGGHPWAVRCTQVPTLEAREPMIPK